MKKRTTILDCVLIDWERQAIEKQTDINEYPMKYKYSGRSTLPFCQFFKDMKEYIEIHGEDIQITMEAK